jgi:hypothetical protein
MAIFYADSASFNRLEASGSVVISPTFISPNTAAQSVILVTGSMRQIQTASVQLYGVNIAPLMIYTTGSQTQTALKVTPTFSGSAAFSGSQQNIIADFGATSVGTQFSVNDITSGSIYMVNDVSGLPIIEALSDWTVNMYNYPTKVFQKTGSRVIITGSLSVAGATTVSTGDFTVSSGEIIATNTRLNNYSIGNTAQIVGGAVNTSGLGYGYWDIGSGNFVVPKGFFGSIFSAAGTVSLGLDETNGITFNAGNGAIRVSRAGIFIANLTNTAGAETGDLVFKTKSGSIAMTEKMRISGSGAVTITTGSLIMPNRPAFRVVGASVTGIPATTTLSGSATTVDYNQGGFYNNTNGIFTASLAGLYHVFLNMRTNSGSTQQAIVYKNTSTAMLMWEATGSFTGHFGVSGILNLAANDNLRVTATTGTVQFDSNDSWGAAYIG